MAREYKVVVTEKGSRRFILELDDDRSNYVEVWMRDSTENGGVEGPYVTVNWKLNRNELWLSKNIFGRGLYSKEMAERHFFAVCNCVINGYEIGRKKLNIAKAVRDYLCNELSDIRVKVNQDNHSVEGDPIDFPTLFEFEKKWGGESRITKIVCR